MPYLRNKNTGQVVFVPDAGGQAVAPNPLKVQEAQAGIGSTRTTTAKTAAQIPGEEADSQVKVGTVVPTIVKATADATTAEQGTRFNGLTPPQYADALAQFNAANYIAQQQADLQRKFVAGPGQTSGFSSLLDFLPLPRNQDFDNSANRLRAWAKQGTGTTGGENNSVAEMKMNLGSYIPSSWSYDRTNSSTLQAIKGLGDKAAKESVQRLGGIPDQNGNITPVPQGYSWGQYPALDRSISRMIGNVPQPARQGWMLRELGKYRAIMAAKQSQRGSQRGSRSINFNDLP